MPRTRRWWVHFPGEVYANGLWHAASEKEVRQQAREYLGVDRLPRGTGVWEQKGPAWWEQRRA